MCVYWEGQTAGTFCNSDFVQELTNRIKIKPTQNIAFVFILILKYLYYDNI